MKKIFTLCVVLCLSYLSMGATNLKHEFRATWLTTAWGNDWPKTKATSDATRKQQQDSLIAIFDRLQAGNMNAVCLQVRGRSDAFYQSSYEPWAAELAGARGKDPGYDPLAFAIEEAHKRGLELHAWVNPFRVTSAGTLDANDLVKKNAGQWIIQYNNGSFTGEIIDPGYPEAREYVLNVLMEIISNYDIDGIVMDDYFYPYGGTTTEDAASKALHKPANVVDVNQDSDTDDDWRRSNVDVFLKELYDRIQAKKPWVRFGMGTFGIWTTQTKVAQAYGISLPSGISGLDDYDEQACNPVEWVKNGYVDYINPQLYWPTTSTGQNYNKLCQWWAKDVCEHFSNQLTNGKKVHFFSSQSISSNSAVSEIQSEIDVNRNNLSSGSTGSVFFDTDAYLTMDNALMTSRFATHALPPSMDWKSNTALAAPTNLTVSGSTLSWQHATAERFTVYAYPKGTAWSTAKNDPSYLQGVIYGNSMDISGIDTNMNDIAVCAYDRFGVEHTAAVYSNDSGAGTTPNPETIIWELNGGEVNTITVEVPTQSDLMLQFMNDYVAYFSTPTIDVDAFHPTGNMTGFLYRGKNTREKSVNEMILDETAGWKWLADYIVSTSASNPTIVAALNSGTEVNWRYSIAAFFEQNGSGTYNVDFSTAGQPAAWGTAYQIAHGAVLLPTYVTSAFTLPIPTHPEGHDFLGWYDNAEFIGSPLTTISADWTGSLYAKWHIIDLTWQITYTSTNGNIVTPNATDVFGANIVSYTYQDGQGVITFDGPVTSIGEKAFYQCKSLASITIPNSVTSIGESAFSECTSLSSVTIPNSVTSIGDWAFANCTSLTSVTLGSGVTSIGSTAFFYCSSLTSITIPKSVTSIGNSAFLGCSSLNAIYITDIAAWCNISFGNNEANPLYDAHNLYLNGKLVTDLVIPNSVTSIRDWAFSYCSSLRSITIPNSVTSIGEHAFYECFSLTSITIPNSVTSIGSSAFSYCSSLTSITIPNSVTSIGDNAFYECSSLTSVAIGNSVTSIGNVAFSNCSSLTSVTIPNSVTTIGYRAFEYCSSLTSITIPNSVTSIRSSAFSYCSSLTSITIPNSVTSIGEYAFYVCSSLTSITIPGSVTNIGESAFAWCTKLGSVYVKCLTPPTIAADAFYNTSPICYIPCGTLSAYKTSNWSSQVSKFIEECEENTITYTTSDGNIVTPYASDVFGVNIVSNTYSNGQGVITFDGPVTSIGPDAFYNCSVLTSITIPNSVTTIGYRAFEDCSSLTSITIPGSVTNIGSSAFEDCSSLTSITIPNSVTSIGSGAFSGCSSLTSITIPNSVTSIGISAFGDCSSITSMTVENGNTVYDSREKCNAIIETATNTLIVGCQNTTIPNNVTSIGSGAFSGCSSLTSITIPNSVTSIGSSAFSDCSSLTSVTIGNSVTSIGNWAFSDCSSLTSVTIGNSVTSIGAYAFYRCSSLTSITIPGSVTNIGESAFYGTGIYNDESNWENKVLYIDDCLIDARASISGAYTINENARLIANRAFGDCSSLTSITIPNSVTSIGDWAFSDCSSLTSITIDNSVTSIGEYAFYKCSSLTSITIPNSVTNIGESAFAWCTKLGSVYVKCLTPPTIAADAFYNTSPICCIPCGTLSTYKTSNWSSQLSKFIEECEENTITYTSSNGNIVTPYASDVFGANIVSNTYSNGQGVITFDGPVTSIGDRAFHNCSSLTSITIPNSVTSIGQNAFYSYVGSSLTSITIPNSVTSIGEGAFDDCYSLTSITIPNSVKSIKEITFSGCSRLTSIVIPNSVTSIGRQAFYECSRLTSIVIPNSVTSIGDNAFLGCSSLSDITLTAHSIEEFYRGKVNFLLTDNGVSNAARHLQINDIEITELTISESVTSVGDYAFYNCSSLTSVTIPNSVTSIGSHAFYGCSSLTSVTIPNSVTSIGDGAFYGCSSLTSATIPESVSSIGEGATFQKCTELKHVYWNATNCTIEQNSNGNYYPPFSSLNNLEEFKFGDNVTNIPIYLCYKLAGLKAIVIPNSVTSIGTGAFSGCSSLTSVTIPNSVTSIGKYAFQDCSSLTSVTIPNSVTSIGTYVFQNCSSLISANIGNNVTNVRDYTFSGCSSLTSVTIPNSVTSVESSAFNDCKALNKITLPASIRSIGPNAFAGCTKLYDIYCFAMEPPTAYESSFANYNAFLHVPCDNQRVYLLDVLFGNFKYIECIEAETTPTDTVVVTPSFNDAEFIWPSNSSADSYTLAISKDGEVFCTLTFNANGQLTGIAFAPSRNGQHNVPAAAQTANGFAFTVTGLDEGSNYTYDLLIQDRSGNTLQSYSGEFRTQSTNDRTVTVEYDAAQGQVTGAGTYLVGDTVTLTAIPNYGYHFVQWSDGNTDNPRTLVLTQDTTFTAEFAINQYSITTTSSHSERGTTQGDTTVNYLEKITISAIANYGYHFSSWNDGNTNNPRVIQVTEDTTYTAQFDKNLYSITLLCNDEQGMVSGVSSAEYLDEVTISANPNYGYHFTQWSDGNTDNPRTLVLTQDTILTAEFALTISGQCGDNLYWAYDEASKTIAITGSGDMYDYTKDTQPWLLFQDQITEVTTSNTTTSIGDWAFDDCSGLTSVTIGNSVTSIGEQAFNGCSSLTSITIPNSVTSIGEGAFEYCSSLDTIHVEATTPPALEDSTVFMNTPSPVCVIPCGTIAAYEASDWASQVGGFVEDCVEGQQIFYTSTDGNIVTPYATDVFGANIVSNTYENGVGTITFDGPVTSIGEEAFRQCSSIASITIPKSVTSIGQFAFGFCSSLTSITIPENVTSIVRGTFQGCSSIVSIVVDNNNTMYDSRNDCNAIIETATNVLVTGCKNTIIPNGITTIDRWAFASNKSLASITIPNTVMTIADHAFHSCSSLPFISIPNSVTSIGVQAFYNCSLFSSFTIPKSVTTIGKMAFKDCTSLDTIYVEATTPPTLGENVLGYSPVFTSSPLCYLPCGTKEAYEASDWAQYVSEFVEEGCAPIQMCGDDLYWEYADGVLTITGTGDMYDYAKDTDVPWYDVRGNIKTVSLPDAMTKIGQNAFYKCTAMTTINMPTSLTAIGEKAFAQDTRLACEIILPASMTTIASRAFFNCQAVTAFHIEATTPPTIPNDAFERTTAPIHVPCGYGHIYGKHTQWGELNLEMCELLQDNVYYYPIDGHTARAVTYHSNSTDTLVIPSAVVIDGMPRTVTEVAASAFADCKDIPAIIFNEGLEYIGERAFVRCYGLQGTIVLPATLETIGERAFSYCDNVEKYLIQAMTPPALGANVFTGDNKNALFYISCEAMDDYKVATNWSSLKSRLRDACLNIYHYNTALGANGVHTTEDTLVASIYYRRQFTTSRWETLYLPFEVDRVTVLEDGVEYDLKAWSIFSGGHYYLAKPYGIENKEVVFGFTQVVDAHTPYIIQFKEPYYHDKMITFHGKESWNKLNTSFEALPISFEMQMAGNTTLQDQILEEPVYMLRASSNFILQNTTTTLHPFECYVIPSATSSGAPARMSVRFRGDVPTAVESVMGNESHLTYTVDGYTLTVYPQGQAFSIYSLNGALIYSCEAGKEAVDCELNSGCYLLHAGAEAHKIML